MTFTVTRQSIPDVLVIEPKVFSDDRGFFLECFRASLCQEYNIPPFVQDNHSHSKKDVLRGLHYQLNPQAMGKLVHCVRGGIFDVAVDIRRGSPSYGHWVSAELTGDSQKMLYVPPGFAHGFCTLTDTADVAYKCTAYYSPDCDRSLLWNDPELAIDWPTREPALSAKDAAAPTLRQADNNFQWVEP